MSKTKHTTVTVGIPAFNEEANIGSLLDNLLKQKQEGFVLRRIVVTSDGSTDNTVALVKSHRDKRITVIDNKVRKGIAVRQNQLIDNTDTDILVLLDADIHIIDLKFLKKLITPIKTKKADLSSCNYEALTPTTFVEKALKAGLYIKNNMFNNLQNGNNVYNCRGTARAFSKRLYESFRFKNSVGEDMYSYLYTIENNYSFISVTNTKILLKLPSTVKDHFKQSIRFLQTEKRIKGIRQETIDKELYIPKMIFISNFLRSFFRQPVYTVAYVYIYFWAKLKARKHAAIDKNWETVDSSKNIKSEAADPAKDSLNYVILIRRAVYIMLNAFRFMGSKAYPQVFVLCYHSIANDNWRFSVSFETFKKQIDYLLKNYAPVSLKAIERHISGKRPIKKKSFALSFDDGYLDNIKVAEYLKSKGIKPSLFLLADPKNANREELETNQGFLNTKEVKKLINLGWEIGCHSATHNDFTSLSENQEEKEIIKAKDKLEKKLGIRIKYFSYPKGIYTKSIIENIKKAGYILAVSMDDKIITRRTNRLTVSRIGVDQTHKFYEFKVVFSRAAIYTRKLIKIVLKTLSHMSNKKESFDSTILQKIIMFFVNRKVTKSMAGRPGLPKKIDDYILIDTIYRPPGDDQYQFGIYQNSRGKKGIVKQWDGKRKDGDYFWLVNEIKIYQGLDQVYKKYGKQISKKFPKTTVPKLLKVIKEKNRLVLFMEMLEGKTLDSINSMPKRMAAFQDVIRYFQYIGKLLGRSKLDKYFLSRKIGHTIAILAYMFLRVSVLYPRKFFYYIWGTLVFISCLPAMIKHNKFTFVHRDLTYMNVLVLKDGRFGAIDFELAVYTHPLYEITQIVTGSWRRKNFWQEFYKLEIMKEILSDKLSCQVYKGLTIFTAIHRMATSPKKDFIMHFSYLLHGLKLKPIQKDKKYQETINKLPGQKILSYLD